MQLDLKNEIYFKFAGSKVYNLWLFPNKEAISFNILHYSDDKTYMLFKVPYRKPTYRSRLISLFKAVGTKKSNYEFERVMATSYSIDRYSAKYISADDHYVYALFLNVDNFGIVVEKEYADPADAIVDNIDAIVQNICQMNSNCSFGIYIPTLVEQYIREKLIQRKDQGEILVKKTPFGLTLIQPTNSLRFDEYINSIIESKVLSSIDYREKYNTISDYIQDNSDELCQIMNDNANVVYNPKEGNDPAVTNFADYLEYKRNFKLFSNQKNTINALLRYYRKEKTGFLIAEQGSGKTSMSIAVASLYKPNRNKNIFVLCPTHVTEKWKNDITMLAPTANVFTCDSVEEFIRDIEPVLRNRKTDNFVLINPKLIRHNYNHSAVFGWQEQATKLQQISLFRQAQDCYRTNQAKCSRLRALGNTLYPEDKEYRFCYETVAEEYRKDKRNPILDALRMSYYASNQEVEGQFSKMLNRKVIGNEVIPVKGFLSLDYYIEKKGRGLIDFFIIDELHEYLSDSAQSNGASRLARSSRKVLGMSGTIFNGYVDNIYYLYRNFKYSRLLEEYGEKLTLIANFRNKYGYKKGVMKFNGHFNMYDYREIKAANYNLTPDRIQCTKYGENDSEYIYCREQSTKKMPGINPEIFTNMLINDCVFMNISDISNEMPQLNENVIAIDLDDTLKEEYANVISDMQSIKPVHRYHAIGATAGWLDDPINVTTNITEYPKVDANNNKLDALIDIINHHKNECVLVYTYYNNYNDINTKILNRLMAEGIKANVLTNSTSAAKRIQWFKKQREAGVRVIICSPSMVETGLDLLDFTTVVFYQMDYRFFTMRQAARRSYRLNQKNNVSLYYLYYKDTVQENIMEYMAQKLRSVKILEGDFDDEGLAQMVSGSDDPSLKIFKNMLSNIHEDTIKDDVVGINQYAEAIDTIYESDELRNDKIIFEKPRIVKGKTNFNEVYNSLLTTRDFLVKIVPEDNILLVNN